MFIFLFLASKAYLDTGVILPLASKWREIGCELGMPTSELENIKTSCEQYEKVESVLHVDTVQHCFHKMLQWWRGSGDTKTFKQISKALHSLEFHGEEKEMQEIHGKFSI